MKHILSVCRALSDRNRLRIVAALVAHDELCACQLTDMLAVSGATASRHLGILLGCGLVASRKAGRWVYYRLAEKDPDAGEFGQVLAWLKAEFGRSAEVALDTERLLAITRCSPEEFCRQYRGKESTKNKKPAGAGGEKNNG